MVMGRNYIFFQNTFISKRLRVAKIANMFIKTTFKDPKKFKRVKMQSVFKMQSVYVFLDMTKVADFR